MRKNRGLNFWISSCVDIYHTSMLFYWCSVCSFTVPSAGYTEEMPALLVLTSSVLLHTELQNSVCFCFCPASPSSLSLTPVVARAAVWRRKLWGCIPLFLLFAQYTLMPSHENPGAGWSRATARVRLLGACKSHYGTGQWKGLCQGKRS